ncbi:MAG: radical SAM protein [Candidatus Gracilibacteria bacterium]|nr:radical SAM protein [Candidatus Gracilibacteria bacterium]
MRKIKHLLLVYFDHKIISYTPLDIAYILAYLQNKVGDIKITVLPVCTDRSKKKNEYKKDIYQIQSLKADAVIFFLDNILWSGMFYEGLAQHLSRKIKKLNPLIHIGFQSYKIRAERSLEELKKNSQIDFILRGEPEIPFLDFCSKTNHRQMCGITYRAGKQIIVNKDASPIKNLDTIPSPYLTGLLDYFIAKRITNFSKKCLFLTASRGCPYRCHYCFRSVKFSAVRRFSPRRVVAEIQYLYEKGVREIFFLDDTFIGAGKYFDDLLVEYCRAFSCKRKSPMLSIMTRPELLTPEAIKNLAKINVHYIQIGIQTLNPDSQYLMGRPADFTSKVFEKIARNCRRYKINLHFDCIFGLPGDTLDYFKQTVDFAISLQPKFMQIKQLYLNPDTLFEINAKAYGIRSGKKLPLNVPFVKSSSGWKPVDIKKAFDFAIGIQRKNPKIRFKILSEYGYFNNF